MGTSTRSRHVTELVAFVERNPWWTLTYLIVICFTAEAIALSIGARK